MFVQVYLFVYLYIYLQKFCAVYKCIYGIDWKEKVRPAQKEMGTGSIDLCFPLRCTRYSVPASPVSRLLFSRVVGGGPVRVGCGLP